jgi:hypothetical protein
MKTVTLYFIIIITNLFVMCGVFSPREITTQPAVDNQTVDPFGFSMLLEGTGAMFSRFAWQEFFHSDLQYTNIHLGSDVYTKDALVNHLQQQIEFFPDVRVTWSEPQSFSQNADKITLSNVAYTIADSSAPDVALFSGSSDFEIVRDATVSIWHIITWKDLSDSSFFSPAK